MRKYRIVTVDDTGSRTQEIVAYDPVDALRTALGNLKTNNIETISAITVTTL